MLLAYCIILKNINQIELNFHSIIHQTLSQFETITISNYILESIASTQQSLEDLTSIPVCIYLHNTASKEFFFKKNPNITLFNLTQFIYKCNIKIK